MEDFIEKAIRTESPNFQVPNPRILHAAMGCVTEAAEMMDAIKKHVYYGKELDVVNLKEEAGDILWYLAILFDELGTSFDKEMKRVIKKLQVRYPDRFTKKAAQERDLEAERIAIVSRT